MYLIAISIDAVLNIDINSRSPFDWYLSFGFVVYIDVDLFTVYSNSCFF